MYNSQYYTCEQIDQRLLQGYLDDYNNQNNTNLTKAQFLEKLASVLSLGDNYTDDLVKLAKDVLMFTKSTDMGILLNPEASTPGTNFTAGQVFIVDEGSTGPNFSEYFENCYHYYIAKKAGISSIELSNIEYFNNTYSSAEAVRLSLGYRTTSELILPSEMDEVLGGEVAVFLTDSDNNAVLDDNGNPIEII